MEMRSLKEAVSEATYNDIMNMVEAFIEEATDKWVNKHGKDFIQHKEDVAHIVYGLAKERNEDPEEIKKAENNLNAVSDRRRNFTKKRIKWEDAKSSGKIKPTDGKKYKR